MTKESSTVFRFTSRTFANEASLRVETDDVVGCGCFRDPRIKDSMSPCETKRTTSVRLLRVSLHYYCPCSRAVSFRPMWSQNSWRRRNFVPTIDQRAKTSTKNKRNDDNLKKTAWEEKTSFYECRVIDINGLIAGRKTSRLQELGAGIPRKFCR